MHLGKVSIPGAMEGITIDIDKLLDSIGYVKIRAYLDFKEGEELRRVERDALLTPEPVVLAQPNYRCEDVTYDIKYEILEAEDIIEEPEDGSPPDNPESN